MHGRIDHIHINSKVFNNRSCGLSCSYMKSRIVLYIVHHIYNMLFYLLLKEIMCRALWLNSMCLAEKSFFQRLVGEGKTFWNIALEKHLYIACGGVM